MARGLDNSEEGAGDNHLYGPQFITATLRIMRQRGLTRTALAQDAGTSESTLNKVFSGARPLSASLGASIADVLDLEPDGAQRTINDIAPDELGAYARRAVEWLEGDYLSVRPATDGSRDLLTYRTTFAWDDDEGHMRFAESDRPPSMGSYEGAISLPMETGMVTLIHAIRGQYRMAILGKRGKGALAGSQIGLTELPSGHVVPTSFPLALVPITGEFDPHFGTIAPEHEDYLRLSRLLEDPAALFPA